MRWQCTWLSPCTKALHAQWVLGGCTVACCSANKGHGVGEAWEVSDSAIKHWTEQLTTLVTLVAHAWGIALNINGQMTLLKPGSALGSDEKMVRAKVEALDIGETALTSPLRMWIWDGSSRHPPMHWPTWLLARRRCQSALSPVAV